MDDEWTRERAVEDEAERGRSADSSVDPQYEDHALPDTEWRHEEES